MMDDVQKVVLVCGSRKWRDRKKIMDRLKQLPMICLIMEGGCEGADKISRICALKIGHDVVEIPANWNGRGKAAGPFRNDIMVSSGPELVLAFHKDIRKSKGTKDCVNRAKKAGIPVEIIK